VVIEYRCRFVDRNEDDVRIVDVPSDGGQCQVAGLRADERQGGLFVRAI
jgi:hypothetical protein